MVPQGPKHYIFGNNFTRETPESSDSMYSSIFDGNLGNKTKLRKPEKKAQIPCIPHNKTPQD